MHVARWKGIEGLVVLSAAEELVFSFEQIPDCIHVHEAPQQKECCKSGLHGRSPLCMVPS